MYTKLPGMDLSFTHECLPQNKIIKLLWRSTATVCKNLQLNNWLVAQQLKNMVFIVKGIFGFIRAKAVHVFKVRSFPKKDNKSAKKSTWNIFSLKCEVHR